MKIVKHILCLVVTFILIYIIQSHVFNNFTIAGVKPNLYIIFVIILGLKYSKRFSLPISGLIGLVLDFVIGSTIGVYMITFILLSLGISYFKKFISSDSKFSSIIIIICATFFVETFYILYQIVFATIYIDIYDFIKIVSIEIVYNVIILILIYPLWKKILNKEEEITNLKRYA